MYYDTAYKSQDEFPVNLSIASHFLTRAMVLH